MPLVRCIGGDTDNIIAALPKSLYVEAYHGGTSDSGYGTSSMSGITVTFSGTLNYSASHSGEGGGSFSFSRNGTTTVVGATGTGSVHFDDGDTFTFSVSASGLGNWARGSESASLTWVAD